MTLPAPYYQDDACTIYHGDCREILPLLPVVDLVLTDPPYGIGLSNGGRSDGYRSDRDWSIAGDHSQEVGEQVLKEIAAIRLPRIVFASPKKPWSGNWRQFLVWDKGPAVGGGGDIATCWKFTWELIQVADTARLNGSRDSAVLNYWATPADSIDHPAQKPLSLLCYLISKTTTTGHTILDPFMGSGTTLRAAKDLGRRAIGIELEEKYCEIAANRLRQEVLF